MDTKAVKLKDIVIEVGKACNVPRTTVNTILAEGFRQMRTAMEQGDRVLIPEFGTFFVRLKDGDPARYIRFRAGPWCGVAKPEKKSNFVQGSAEGPASLDQDSI